MSPEQLTARIVALENRLKTFEAASTIPYEVDQAFRSRLKSSLGLSVSAKSATSENKAVNEAGASSYSVLNIPDGFLQVTVGATTYYVPIFL